MKAETAYNVIQALPKEEILRLYRMLGVKASGEKKVKVRKKKKPLITDAEATEFLLMYYRKKK